MRYGIAVASQLIDWGTVPIMGTHQLDSKEEVVDLIVYIIIGAIAGLMGSMMGIGGGVLIVPVLSLFLKVPIHQAIAASAVALIANSSTGAVRYVRQGIANIRLGMTMETMTAVGAVLGGFTASLLSREVLSGVFALLLVVMSIYIYIKARIKGSQSDATGELGLLGASYHDEYLKRDVRYRTRNLPVGLGASLVAGNLSGLLGIGGGVIQVPVMSVAMGVPMKAAAATSNFMIGITACAGAYVHYIRGMVNPTVAVPIALGVTLGAYVGSRLTSKVSGASLTIAFAILLVIFAIQMGLAAFGISYR